MASNKIMGEIKFRKWRLATVAYEREKIKAAKKQIQFVVTS